MTTWRDDLSRLAEEVEEAGMAEAWSGYWISSRVRTLLASHPESAPAPHCPTCRDRGYVGSEDDETCPACASSSADKKEEVPARAAPAPGEDGPAEEFPRTCDLAGPIDRATGIPIMCKKPFGHPGTEHDDGAMRWHAVESAPGEDGDLRERLAKAERSEHERWRMCDGSCDIALARRQVGPDGVVPGNAKECAELWEREASRLHSALLGSQRAEATAVERAHQADQRLTKAREALRELLDHCEEEVDGEQGEDTVCIMCGGGDPCAPDCPVGRARAALKSLEGA